MHQVITENKSKDSFIKKLRYEIHQAIIFNILEFNVTFILNVVMGNIISNNRGLLCCNINYIFT